MIHTDNSAYISLTPGLSNNCNTGTSVLPTITTRIHLVSIVHGLNMDLLMSRMYKWEHQSIIVIIGITGNYANIVVAMATTKRSKFIRNVVARDMYKL